MTTQQDRAELIERLNSSADWLEHGAKTAGVPLASGPDLRKAAALLKADGKAGGEVALWVSPGQFENLKADPEDEAGTYLPVRHTTRGKFTMPLYTRPQPAAQVALPDALRIALEDLDSTEPIGPTTEAVIDAAQRWYLAAPKAAQVAQPLTPERIMEIAREAGFNLEPTANWLYTVRGNAAQVINAIRLAEAAHGIGKDQA